LFSSDLPGPFLGPPEGYAGFMPIDWLKFRIDFKRIYELVMCNGMTWISARF